MTSQIQDLIKQAYHSFNTRNIDAVLRIMKPDVCWPNGWEGGYVKGHNEVRNYWKRQWKEIDPRVTPVSFTEREDGKMEVKVHQIVKDRQGNILSDSIVKHIYTFEKGKVKSMEIEN